MEIIEVFRGEAKLTKMLISIINLQLVLQIDLANKKNFCNQ